MSADNGINVAYNTGEYEVRYWQGEGKGRVRRKFAFAIPAILHAHQLQNTENTEYGVSVTNNVLTHAVRELRKQTTL